GSGFGLCQHPLGDLRVRSLLPIEAGDAPLHGAQAQPPSGREVCRSAHATRWSRETWPGAGGFRDDLLCAFKLLARLVEAAKQVNRMRVGMITGLVAFLDHSSSSLWKQFHLTAKHEKCRLEAVAAEHVKQFLSVFRWT